MIQVLRGRLAGELLKEAAAPSGIRRAVGIAAMNALADMCWERRPTAGVDLCTGVARAMLPKFDLVKMSLWLERLFPS